MSAFAHSAAPSASSAPSASFAPSEGPKAGVRFEVEGLLYHLDRSPRPHGRRSVVVVRLAEHREDPGFRDRLDLFAFKSRRTFAGRVADAFGRQTGQILGHLASILDEVERGRAAAARPPRAEELSASRRAAADAILESGDPLCGAARVMERLGYVGQERAKRICYLAATSRLLPRPVSVVLRADSGSGKSALLEAVAGLLPEEATLFLSRLTSQALFYAGPEALRHKLVVVDELAGQSGADYSLRTLQSRGKLSLTSTVQGRAETREVFGPISLLSGTTRSDLDPENMSRVLEVGLDESPAQTARIHRAHCLVEADDARSAVDPRPWQDAQRLLRPARVVVPYAPKLRFPARTPADRRVSQKVLGLIQAHALLHQRRRPRTPAGSVVAEVADYAGVHALLCPALAGADGLDGLGAQATRLYRWLSSHVERRLTRRDVARELGVAYNTAKRALCELVSHELAVRVDVGPPARYRLLDATVSAQGFELLAPDALE